MKKLALLAVIGLAGVGSALAQNTAAFHPGGGNVDSWGGSTGWRFTVNSAISVNMLGFYDIDGDGLAGDHNVGLFEVSNPGVALSTAVLAAGTGDALIDGSRFVMVASVVLNPGTEYYILADNTFADNFVWGTTTVSADLNCLGFTDTLGTIYDAPNHFSSPDPNLGPNFRYGAVPEPATLAALGLGLAALRRRRK